MWIFFLFSFFSWNRSDSVEKIVFLLLRVFPLSTFFILLKIQNENALMAIRPCREEAVKFECWVKNRLGSDSQYINKGGSAPYSIWARVRQTVSYSIPHVFTLKRGGIHKINYLVSGNLKKKWCCRRGRVWGIFGESYNTLNCCLNSYCPFMRKIEVFQETPPLKKKKHRSLTGTTPAIEHLRRRNYKHKFVKFQSLHTYTSSGKSYRSQFFSWTSLRKN